MKNYRVVENIKISETTWLLSVERDVAFVPGQVVKISVDAAIPPRLYSICSANTSKHLTILYKVKNNGLLTPKLQTLVSGNEVLMSKPLGTFICNNEPLTWIATGTGIAPFYAMATSAVYNDIILIQGAAKADDIYFIDFFRATFGSKYFPCTSKVEAPDCHFGRVTQFIKSFNGIDLKRKYYLCGSAEMVVDVRDQLISLQVPFNAIHAEIYF